ncbi:MAG TPA: hypothetical protein VG734_13240 [Lacunisphaera sp.]|nr:hypothetical protein [Lacunisphaera sp.]
MNSTTAENPVPLGARARVAPARHAMSVAILSDVHFWVPVAVLALGLGLLVYLS